MVLGAATDYTTAVITAMHGYAFGLAIDLSCCADIRIASKDTKFSVKEVDIGLAADIGTLARLPKIVGNHSWVKEVTLTARVFGAEEAYRVGFVSHVTENKEKAVEKAVGLATLIASKSPIAVQGTKELLNHARENTTAASKSHTHPVMRIAPDYNSSSLHWSLELCRFTYRRCQVRSSVWNPEDEAHVLEVVRGETCNLYRNISVFEYTVTIRRKLQISKNEHIFKTISLSQSNPTPPPT